MWSSFARASYRRQSSSCPWLRNSGSRLNRSWMSWKCFFLHLFLQLVSRKVFLVSWLFIIFDVHEVFISWWHTQGLNKKIHRMVDEIADWPLFLCATNARTCCRTCLYSSMMDTLRTAFWVPSRVIHITRSSQHPELFVLTLDWKDQMIDFVVDLVEKHVDLNDSQLSE